MAVDVDPFRFQVHPDVWLLVAFLTGSYVYMVRVVGPHAVAVGPAGRDPGERRRLRRRDGAAVGGQRLADPRPRRELPLLGPHAPAHDAELLPAAAGAAGDPGVAAAGAGRERPRLRRAAVVLPSGRRRGAVQRLGDGHPHPRRRERLGAERRPPLPPPRDGGDLLAAGVDARRRAVPRVPAEHDGQDDLPLPAVGRADRAGGLADVRRRGGVPVLRRAAGAGVGDLGHRRPAARRGDHEDRRLDLPLVDHRRAVVHPLLGVRTATSTTTGAGI